MGRAIEGARQVLVVMSWGGTPHGSVLISAGERVVIGDEEGATFLLPTELSPGAHVLVESDEVGFVLRAPAGTRLRANRTGAAGDTETLFAEEQSADAERTVRIDRSTRAEVMLGEIAFHVSEPAAEAGVPLAKLDFSTWRWAGVSFAVHAALLTSFFFMPPNAGALSLDLSREQRDYVRIHLDAMEMEQALEPEPTPSPAGGAQAGQASAGEEGTAGAPDERRNTGGGVQVRGRSDDDRVPLTASSIQNLNVLATIRAFATASTTISSPYGAADAMGSALSDAYGALTADALGMGQGTGGLGMHGVGRGGGCLPGQDCGAGTIGVGGLGTGFGTCGQEDFRRIEATQGHAAAMQSCAPGMVGGGQRVGLPGRDGHRVGRVPVMRMGEATTIGGLDREAIRRVVSRNRVQVRHCYETALMNRPDLEGRVSVRWMVKQDGSVMGASIVGSELNDPSVEACMAQAVSRWAFPQSEGVTAVTYPFVLQSQ